MDINIQNDEQKCLVNALSRLRESSMSAVVSADMADDYTMYMHVDRPVQTKFVEVLQSTYNSNHAELILLCGSVGDGKSHMLSYCNEKYQEMMSRFYVHNDSTASLYVDKPASFTLKSIMEPFCDEKINDSTDKVILAINLGTLNNFIESDTDNRFTLFKKYVEAAGIFSGTSNDDFDETYFHSVNFADYHMYELLEDRVSSHYISGIFRKITQDSSDNVFFEEYGNCCLNCQNAEICPIKANYELLSNKKVQNGIISVLVEAIVKNKLILSTRSFLNMIYEILVDERYFDRGSVEPRKLPENYTQVDYYKALLPNTLFGKDESSEIFDAIKTVDPMRIRNENIDDFFVYYENSSEVLDIFKKDLPSFEYVLNKVKGLDFADPALHGVKEILLRTYVRLCRLADSKMDLIPLDEDYREYMTALYQWNIGDNKSIKNVFSTVSKAVLLWNGYAENNEMQLLRGNQKSSYHLVQEIKIKPVQTNSGIIADSAELCSFKDEIKLTYRSNDSASQLADLDLDYSLYKLLKSVLNGYIPSVVDKRVNVKCVEFINKISQWGSKGESLEIRDLTQKEMKQYTLSYEDGFGYSFEVN